MKIAILHYHLNTGGVTRVIHQQAGILRSQGHEVILLSGEPPPVSLEVPVEVVQGLAYDHGERSPAPAKEVAVQIMKAVGRHWTDLPDVLHIHNPILAKNSQIINILNELQKNSIPLLCQVHDFAEDGRPNVFFHGPYPSNCHYAVINLRDYEILKAAGLSSRGLHYLPNAVSPWTGEPDDKAATRGTVLYPVRAIRRKNIAEAILLHYCRHPHRQLLITLPPTSTPDMAAYALWRRFVAEQGLNVVFEAGLQNDFKWLTSQCDYVLTTSITEGFGFVFLEAWTGSKLLSGRKLPDICQDFINHGIQLNHLYRCLGIPLSWINELELHQIWLQTIHRAARKLSISLPAEWIASGWQQITSTGHIDFGLLDEGHQHQILCKVIQDKGARDQLRDGNSAMNPPANPANYQEMIEGNRQAVLRHYGIPRYRENLMGVYDQVVTHPVKHAVDKKTVAMHFLAANTFSLLKWRPFHG